MLFNSRNLIKFDPFKFNSADVHNYRRNNKIYKNIF